MTDPSLPKKFKIVQLFDGAFSARTHNALRVRPHSKSMEVSMFVILITLSILLKVVIYIKIYTVDRFRSLSLFGQHNSEPWPNRDRSN